MRFVLKMFICLIVFYPVKHSAQYITSTRNKVILVWSPRNHVPLASLGIGNEAFVQSECKATNCFVTSDRAYFPGGNLTKFDAIAFSGHMLDYAEDLPTLRSPHQKYIFFSSEPASQRPICNKKFDNFFNWTATYRLDSDIPWTYFHITETIKGESKVIGPRNNIKWRLEYPQVTAESLLDRIKKKSKAVAWFTGNICSSISGRENYALSLHYELLKLGSKVQVHGGCGTIKCTSLQQCLNKLDNDYFFYLAMEPFLSNDFVTQELLVAVTHDVVPIVLGAANYSRFLPPGSYLEASVDPAITARTIVSLMKSPSRYSQYFRWKKYYSYRLPKNLCRLCVALNMKAMMSEISIYREFRYWWYPNYEDGCKWYNFVNRMKNVLG